MSSESISVACKNCTFSGTANIKHGTLTASGTPVNTTDDESTLEEIEGFFNHGFIALEVNDFGAYIELETIIDSNQTVEYTGHMTVNGEPIPIQGFQVSSSLSSYYL